MNQRSGEETRREGGRRRNKVKSNNKRGEIRPKKRAIFQSVVLCRWLIYGTCCVPQQRTCYSAEASEAEASINCVARHTVRERERERERRVKDGRQSERKRDAGPIRPFV